MGIKIKTFEQRIFLTSIPYNALSALLIFLYGLIFITMPPEVIIPVLVIASAIFALEQFLTARFTHHFITQGLSNDIAYFFTSGMEKKEQHALIKHILRYPIHKALETYFHFVAGSFLQSVAFVGIFHFDLYTTSTFFIICTVTTYIAFALSLHNTQLQCSAAIFAITERMPADDIIDKKHFFGIPMFALFLLYVTLPVVLCIVLCILVVRLNHTERTMIYISLVNIATISALATLFFQRIRRYSALMTQMLGAISENKTKNIRLIPTDFSNEISYSIHLLNKTLLLFRKFIADTSRINTTINDSAISLSSIANETASTSKEQFATSEGILHTMEAISDNSTKIQVTVDEVINVANQTSDQVNKNFKKLHSNLSMMKDITEANQTTINGIQSLSNKLNNVQDIVNLINSVATQTKIIAFNTELEAGGNMESDSVAKEIRLLADKTITLTKDIQTKIDKIKLASENLIGTGQNCMDKIAEGNEISTLLEQRFVSIQSSAAATTANSRQIKDSIEERAKEFSQIVLALQQIKSDLGNINASSQVISTTVHSLQHDSQQIQNLIDKLNASPQADGQEKDL